MPDFSARHYEKLARALGASNRRLTAEDRAAWKAVMMELCHMMAQDNPRFDLEYFLSAVKKHAQ